MKGDQINELLFIACRSSEKFSLALTVICMCIVHMHFKIALTNVHWTAVLDTEKQDVNRSMNNFCKKINDIPRFTQACLRSVAFPWSCPLHPTTQIFVHFTTRILEQKKFLYEAKFFTK